MPRYLLDTNILIEYFKKNQAVKNYIDTANLSLTSYINAGEFIQGAKNKPELKSIQKLLSTIKINYGSTTISKLALKLTTSHTLSHSTGFADALIAATAIETNTTLLTLNTKHFSPIKGLKFKHPRTRLKT